MRGASETMQGIMGEEFAKCREYPVFGGWSKLNRYASFAEFSEYLAACAARAYRGIRVRSRDSESYNGALSYMYRMRDRIPFRANRQSERSILDIGAGDDASVAAFKRGPNTEM